MAYTARYWDKTSPINGCPADKAAQSLGVGADQQLGILSADGRDCITQIFAAMATAEDLQAWCDQVNADAEQQAQAQQEQQTQVKSQDERIAELGQQVSSLTLANATLGQQVAALTLQLAAKGGETA